MQSTAIPVELSKYFIDVMTSNEMFATACLNVLQSPSVWSNDYFQVSVKPHHIRASLITLGPLLEYAVLYWPGFACTFAEAISKEDGLCWLEEYIRFGGIDIGIYAVERIRERSPHEIGLHK
ncbi:hypothetical protein FQN53_009508 [Emmonsiellopsis sp. PD_33]|nr:hypothetical protein FQN53_009508 [Emmonsiellopsis sp. PD_33]